MPKVVCDYNHRMNGCDRVDQCVSYYGQYGRKTVKWWRRVFLWLLEVCQYNAYILYCLTRADGTTRISLQQFKRQLITQLVDNAVATGAPAQSAPHPGRPRLPNPLERYVETKHLVKFVPQDRNCVVCRNPSKRRRTNFVCGGCTGSPHLHPKDCFQAFHTKN